MSNSILTNQTIEFVLQDWKKDFYNEDEENPIVELGLATRYESFQEALKHLEKFETMINNRAYIRPVIITVQLLD